MLIEVRVRGRFWPIPGATARQIAGNAWEISVPRTSECQRLLGNDLGRLDGAVLGLDGKETEAAVINAEGPEGVRATAWILG
jgi:hypothetical protein